MIGKTILHYNITEKLGGGGMGVVYLAEDSRLRRKVALKFLPQQITSDAGGRQRFEIEAQAAASLNHPNIATIHAIEEVDTDVFIVMEYVEGKELKERLSVTPLKIEEVIDIGIQIAEGLRAAHEKGIIHRDIKSANIMITGTGQVKVMDFGLAKLTDAESGLTKSGATMGTIAYMSPEQTRGEPVDLRTDIWSLGVLLYETVTGKLPFSGDKDATVVYSILMKEPLPLSSVRGDIPAAMERIIHKALSKNPDTRYRNISEMLNDLYIIRNPGDARANGKKLHADVLSPRAPNMAPGRRVIIAAAALIFLVLVFFLWRGGRFGAVEDPIPEPAQARRAFAVLGFQNLSGNPENDWFSMALSEMLTTELASENDLRAVHGDVVSRMQNELNLVSDSALDNQLLSKIYFNIGAQLLVNGGYLLQGQGDDAVLRVDLRVLETTSGKIIATFSNTGATADLINLVVKMGSQFRHELGLEAPPLTETRKAIPVASLETTQNYVLGLQKLRHFDAPGALPYLRKAVTAGPAFAAGHSALATAWKTLGYDVRAQQAAQKALALSANLNREDRLMIEGRYREYAYEWDKAVDIYKILFGFFTDNLEYGLRLAQAQISAGDAKSALLTIEQLRRLPAPASQDARIDLAECSAAESLSDYNRERIAAVRARMKAVTMGANLLIAESWYDEGLALWQLGEPAKAVAAYEEAGNLFTMAGNRMRGGDMLAATAVVKWDEGKLEEALQIFEEALALKQETGQKGGIASILNSIGNVQKDMGELARAKQSYQQAISIGREVDDPKLATNLSNLGNVLKETGDLAGAEELYLEAAEAARHVGNIRSEAVALMNLAELRHIAGNLDGAQQAHVKALHLSRRIARKRDAAFSLWGLGRLQFTRGDFARAHAYYDSAAAAYREIEVRSDAEDTRLWKAELLIEEGRYTEAEHIIEETLPFFQEEKMIFDVLVAEVLKMHILYEEKKLEEARQSILRIRELAGNNQNFELQAWLAVNTAQVEAASGQTERAEKRLREVLHEAQKLGFLGIQFDARLALAEVEKLRGNRAAATRLLKTLEADAAVKGFGLVARRAAALIEPVTNN